MLTAKKMVLVIANFPIHEYCMEGEFLDNVTHKVVKTSSFE